MRSKFCLGAAFTEKLLNFKHVEISQILMGYKTYFVRPGHIYGCIRFSFTLQEYCLLHVVYICIVYVTGFMETVPNHTLEVTR